MTNKTNFNGWSGSTFDITKLNFSGRTTSVPQKSSSIVNGPIVITNNRPKKSTFTLGVKQTPVAKVKSEVIFDATKASKLGRPSMLSSSPLESNNLPFTAGTIDTSFPYGVDTGFNGEVYVSKVQSDGKILIGGDFTNYNYNGYNYYSPYLIRLNSDGSPDFDFAYTYHADDAGWMINGGVRTIDIQSDGKILIGGGFDAYSGGTYYYSSGIMRFNSDGTFDNTLFVGDGFNDEVLKIIVQPDGKILVVGIFFQYNNTDNWRIIRLNSNGTPDSSFITGDGIDFDDYGIVYDMILQPDGKIILGGDFYNYNGVESDYIVRLNSNGSYDNTFVTGAGFNDTVSSLALQSDGKIIVGGDFNYYNNIDLYSGYIVRLGVNGEMDTRFGYGLDNTVYSLTIQSDDKILVGGSFGDFYPYDFGTINIDNLVRFQSDCTLDLSFVFDSGVYNGSVLSITLDSDDRIYVGGSFYEDGSPFLLNRFGRLNNSILEYPYVYTVEACTQPLVDETITYVIGSMTELNPFITYSLQSIQNPSITVCGFLTDTYPSNVIEYTAVNTYYDCEEAYKSNNKLVIVEDGITGELFPWVVDNKYEVGDIFYINQILDEFTRFFVKFAAKIIEITPWSEYDGFFGDIWYYLPPSNYVPYSSFNDAIEANGVHYVVVSPIEQEATFPLIHKMYSFDDYDNAKVSLLEPTGINPVKTLVDYLPFDQYSLISGGTPEIYSTVEFRGDIPYVESSIKGLTAMSPNGVLNDFFNNTGFDGNLVHVTVEQPDGKILVGGDFSEYLEIPVGNFMRINPDGTIDETFYLGQFNSGVRAITLQPDGKILVGGNFTNYDGYNAGYIIRLNSDGTIDRNFTFNTEFNGSVNAIAVQWDGKIVVGGSFSYYYDFYCPQIVRLNSNGSPDRTFVMGDGFDGDQVYTILLNPIRIDNSGSGNVRPRYVDEIIVGGRFTWYNGTTVRGIVKLSPTGEVLPDFGVGFNDDTGGTPRVNNIVQQPDGKLIVVGGSYGNNLLDYNGTWIPQNIVRLVKSNRQYVIDETFVTRNFDNGGGFGASTSAVSVLPNGKIMIGGFFNSYGDNNDDYSGISHLVRLNSDGTLDQTFTFEIDRQVSTASLLSSGILIVGGRFSSPMDLMLELFIGEEYVLRSFDTCDGLTSNIFLPTEFPVVPSSTGGVFSATPITYEPISIIGLDLAYDGDYDDDNFVIVMPTPFDVNFLGTNYTSINVSSNPYITFGDGGNPGNCCFDIPNEIPSDVSLPGVFLSFSCPNDISDYDAQMYQLYSGLTDGGNTMVIKYIGSDHCDQIATLVYGFKFYKDNSDYFDLIIENNDNFFNDDPTGGVSNGVDETWVTTFDSTGGNAYRIGSSTVSGEPIKANINDRVAVCGTVGDVITTPQLNGGPIGGSMYFDGVNDTMVQINNDGGQFGFGGGNDFTIEWFQYYEGGSNSRPFTIGVYNTPTEMIGMSFEETVYLWIDNINYNTNIINDDLLNGWHHIAITRNYVSGDRTWKVFLDGIEKTSLINNNDTTNTYTLTLGNQLNNDGRFQGYITNFRVTDLTALYTSNFIVPTQPLTCDGNTILTMDATNESGLLYDSCEDQTISATGVTWSSETPFVNLYDFSLFTATNYKNYSNCTECDSTTRLNAIAYERGNNTPDRVVYRKLTKQFINDVLTKGPIWTDGPFPYCYELLKYYK
jgi:uncharacterized delta-60 repeat protein